MIHSIESDPIDPLTLLRTIIKRKRRVGRALQNCKKQPTVFEPVKATKTG